MATEVKVNQKLGKPQVFCILGANSKTVFNEEPVWEASDPEVISIVRWNTSAFQIGSNPLKVGTSRITLKYKVAGGEKVETSFLIEVT